MFLREPRALFTGDNVMGTGTSVVNPGEGEIALYLETLEKFMRYDPAVIYPGQGPVVTSPRAKLQELIQHRREREAQIVTLLTQGPKSVDDLFRVLYSGLDERMGHLARNQIRSHLIKLEHEGRVSASGKVYHVASPGRRERSRLHEGGQDRSTVRLRRVHYLGAGGIANRTRPVRAAI